MRIFVLCLLGLLCIGCTDDVGTINLDETANEFSIFIPNIGTFDFKQSYEINDDKPPRLITSIQVEPKTFDRLEYEILAFQGDTTTFANLVMVSRGLCLRTDSVFKEIDRNTDVLLESDKLLINILRLDSTVQDKSGHYEGVSKLVTPGDETQDDSTELFSFFGFIDHAGQLLLFPTTSITSFDYIEGQYNEQDQFTGKAMLNDVKVSDIVNQFGNFELQKNGKLTDSLFLTINEIPKRVFLNIQKIEL